MKEALSTLLLPIIVLSHVIAPIIHALNTNGSVNPWTRDKATHLARSVLFYASPEIIDSLEQAGSAEAAVNILFPNAIGPDRSTYDNLLRDYTSSGFNWGDGNHAIRLYQLIYTADPYEGKRKLFSLFEDIFSVSIDNERGITYKDIHEQHNLIYENMLGNYQTLVKRILYNNGNPGDYAQGSYLDLLNQKDPKNPNENYARELLQLFLMGEYEPFKSKENEDIRNYEESDVRALSRILTGLKADAISHAITFDISNHYSGSGIVFLSGTLNGIPPAYYDSASGTIDPMLIVNPVMSNNGLTDNTIEYIFAKRSQQIALFLADRMYRFYIHDVPTRSELDTIASIIISNNFEILPSVRQVLSHDMMYSDKSMNDIRYKNPLELSIGTIKLMQGNNIGNIMLDPNVYDTNLLRRLGWTPYFPGSVFGRDGFDDSTKWTSTSNQNVWMSATNYFTYRNGTGSVNFRALLGKYRTETTNELVPIITNSKNSFTGSLRISSGFLDTHSGSAPMTARATIFSSMSDTGVTDTGSTDGTLQTDTGSINPKANTGSTDTLTGSTGSGTMKESSDSSTGNTMTMTETGSSLSGTIDTMQQSGSTDSGSTQIQKDAPTSSGVIKAMNESLDMTVTMDIGTGGNVPEVKISSAVSSNGIITLSSGSVTLPLFQLNTDAGILSISGGLYDASTKTLSITSGSLLDSGSIIPIYSGTIIMTNDGVLSSDVVSADTIIDIYSNYILGSFPLPQDVQSMFQRFLETDENNNPILITPSTNEYYDKKIRGLISMLLAQPEYVLLRGADKPTETNSYEQRFLDNIKGKLIFIELYGGNDYLSSIIPKDEYDVYYNSRASSSGSIAVESNNLVDIGNFYMNSALAYGSGGKPGFKSLYDEGSLKLFNRVGGYKHSQDHDAAAKQISSFDSTTSNFAEGVFGHLIKNEFESSHTISLGARRPNVYRGGKYVNMGGSIILSNPMNNSIKYHMDVLEDMVQLRQYPGNTRSIFSDAGRISDIAKTSVAAGGPGGANGDMNNIFRFMKILMENNIGRSYYMGGFGGYDTHGEQVDTLNRNLNYVSTAVTEFFNSVKSNQDITIIIFSEFGRTNKVNGSVGTDHGDGGGMYVLTSNPALKNMLSSGTYGNMSIRNAKSNSLGVGVDYRSVYGKIYEGIYGVDGKTYFQDQSVSLESDISTTPNNMSLLSYTYQASGKNIIMNGEFTISGSNYNPGKAGYTRVLAGTGISNLKNTNTNMTPTANGYKYTFRISSNSQPYFQIQSFSNQYALNEVNGVLTGSLMPTILGGNTRSISLTGSSILPIFNNSTVPNMMSGSGIILDATGGTIVALPYNPDISFRFGTGLTRITELTSNSGILTWNGGFLLGEEVDKNIFVPQGAIIQGSGEILNKNQIIRLIKIGADKLGVGMKLNQPMQIEFRNIAGTGSYRILSSEDGILWTDVESSGREYIPNSGGTILFSTDHFSYFALKSNTVTPVEIIPSCTINISPAIVNNNTNVQVTWNISNTMTGVLMPNNTILDKNGSLTLIPPPNSSTTYTINVRNSAGSSSCTSSVLTVAPNTGSGSTGTGSGSTGTGTNNPTPSNVGPGGGGGTPRASMKDICTDGDFSGDAYDGSCDLPTESRANTPTTDYSTVKEENTIKKEIREFLNNYTANSRNNGENDQILWGISLKLWRSIARTQDNKDVGLQQAYVILREELRDNRDSQAKEAIIQIMRNLQTLRNNAGDTVDLGATKKTQVSEEVSTTIKYVSAENSLSIRSSTTIADNIIGYLDRNQKVEVTGIFGEWAKIRYNNTEGFVKSRYLRDIKREDRVRTGELPPDTSDQGWISVKHTAFVRRGGQFDAQIVGVVEDDDMVIILDEKGNWLEVLWNGMHGYIAKWLVQKERR